MTVPKMWTGVADQHRACDGQRDGEVIVGAALEEEDRDERGDHRQVALRHVDGARVPENDHDGNGGQGIEAACRQPTDDLLAEQSILLAS